jgi:hypothetical protein
MVRFFDSCGGSGKPYIDLLKRYLTDEVPVFVLGRLVVCVLNHALPISHCALQMKKRNGDAAAADVATWTLVPTEMTTPRQDNGVDCGVFMCYFAKYVGADKPFDFTCKDIPELRRRLTLDILRRKISYADYTSHGLKASAGVEASTSEASTAETK